MGDYFILTHYGLPKVVQSNRKALKKLIVQVCQIMAVAVLPLEEPNTEPSFQSQIEQLTM